MRSYIFLIENLDRNRIIRILFPFDRFEDWRRIRYDIFKRMHRVGSFVIFLIENFDPVKKSNYSSLVFEVRYDVCKRIYYELDSLLHF